MPKEFEPAIKRFKKRIRELKDKRVDFEESGLTNHADTCTNTIQCLYVAISVLQLTDDSHE